MTHHHPTGGCRAGGDRRGGDTGAPLNPLSPQGTSGHWQWPSLGRWGLGGSPQSTGGLSCCGSCPSRGTTWKVPGWPWGTTLPPGPSLGMPGTGEGVLGGFCGVTGSTGRGWGGYWEVLRGSLMSLTSARLSPSPGSAAHQCHWCRCSAPAPRCPQVSLPHCYWCHG